MEEGEEVGRSGGGGGIVRGKWKGGGGEGLIGVNGEGRGSGGCEWKWEGERELLVIIKLSVLEGRGGVGPNFDVDNVRVSGMIGESEGEKR